MHSSLVPSIGEQVNDIDQFFTWEPLTFRAKGENCTA